MDASTRSAEGRTEMIEFYRYVRYEDIPVYEAKGWVVDATLGLPHGAFSVLMKWMGEGEPE